MKCTNEWPINRNGIARAWRNLFASTDAVSVNPCRVEIFLIEIHVEFKSCCVENRRPYIDWQVLNHSINRNSYDYRQTFYVNTDRRTRHREKSIKSSRKFIQNTARNFEKTGKEKPKRLWTISKKRRNHWTLTLKPQHRYFTQSTLPSLSGWMKSKSRESRRRAANFWRCPWRFLKIRPLVDRKVIDIESRRWWLLIQWIESLVVGRWNIVFF